MDNQLEGYLERRLQEQIEELNIRIQELSQERDALQRQLIKVRGNIAGLKDVNRRSSITRVMIETRIVEILKKARKPQMNKSMYKIISQSFPNLKEATFRSHLHRLKQRGTIESAGQNGFWRLKIAEEGRP